MAGGKLTPRQKMINLMYLVFIAMLALNMSKEVLSAFGLMNEKFESVNKFSEEYNKSLFGQLESKASDDPTRFNEPLQKAKQIKPITDQFYAYIEGLKKNIEGQFEKEDGKLPYEAMDKGDMIDEQWFEGDGYSKKGKEIIAAIEKYKNDLKTVIGTDVKYKFIIDDINAKFDLSDIKDGDGVKKQYLDYHYKGFPAIASLTKLSAMQNDVRKTEQDIYNGLIGNTTAQAASMKNYKAMVIMDKSAFFQGETVTGRVVLGRYDESTVPTSVSVNGGTVTTENGQAVFKLSAGSVGEHDIKGKFVFLEDGKEVPIEIEDKYVVVPKPNSATISADKMNSVYRGVDNPMTVSFAGIPDNNVKASAPGNWRSAGKAGKYNWNVTQVAGKTAKITVTAKLPDGKSVSDVREFNVREIPAPTPEIRGKQNSGKGNKNDLASSTIRVAFPDFVFDVRTTVTSFEVFIPGSPAMICQGDRFSPAALAAIAKTKRGDVVTINNIKTKLEGAGSYQVKGSGSFAWEIQ
jgi:gliding motility-associated protein GldM